MPMWCATQVCIGKTLDQIFLVMEFVEHDLKTLLTSFHPRTHVLCALRGQDAYAPAAKRDCTAARGLYRAPRSQDSNLLMNNRGILKVADFAWREGTPIQSRDGSHLLSRARAQARRSSASSASRSFERGMTDLVVTLWYRAPELLLLNQIAESREREHKHASHRASSSQPAPDQARAQDPPCSTTRASTCGASAASLPSSS